jgi:hypothetical protein
LEADVEDRYRVTVLDVNGRHLNTEDVESEAAKWLWRTLKHLRETWPSGCIFDSRVYQFEKLS